MTFFFQTNPIRVIFKIVLALSSSIMTWAGGVQQVKSSQIKVRTFILKRASHGSGGWIKASCNRYAFVRKKKSIFKGVVDCFFSRLDCVYGVQSSMCSCLVFLKTHSFSHNLPLFHTSLSLLWQTPRFISWFLWSSSFRKRDGLRLVSWLSVLWFAKTTSMRLNVPPLASAACAPVEL